MKVDIKSKQRVFEPIEITITIESQDELIDFFDRSRINAEDLYSALEDGGYDDIDYPSDKSDSLSMALYGKLYMLMGKLNKHSED